MFGFFFKMSSFIVSDVEFYKNNVVTAPVRPFEVAFGLSGTRSDATIHGRLIPAKCAPFYVPLGTQTVATLAPIVDTVRNLTESSRLFFERRSGLGHRGIGQDQDMEGLKSFFSHQAL